MEIDKIYNMEIDKIYNMDCLEGMTHIPDGSIDAIICDLPYGTMKGAAIEGWVKAGRDTSWDEIIPTDKLFDQYERILRKDGVAILFSQEPYTSHLRNFKYRNSNFPFAYPLIWEKDHYGNPLVANVAPVSYFEDISVFYKQYDTHFDRPVRKYFEKVFAFIGKDKSVINREIDGNVDHTFRLTSKHFVICNPSVYQQFIDKYHIDKMEGFMTYEEVRELDKKWTRTFNLPEGQNVKSNILRYAKDTDGFHPTQKPVALIADLIRTYSNEGDTILDNCMGSGTTAVACIKEKRHFIGFELNKEYYDKACQRIDAEQRQLSLF